MHKITFNHDANTLSEVLGFSNKGELSAQIMSEGPESELAIVAGLATIFFSKKAENFALMVSGLLGTMFDQRLDQPSKVIELIYNHCDTEDKKMMIKKFIIAFHEIYLGEDLDALEKFAEGKPGPTSIKDLQAMFDKERKAGE